MEFPGGSLLAGCRMGLLAVVAPSDRDPQYVGGKDLHSGGHQVDLTHAPHWGDHCVASPLVVHLDILDVVVLLNSDRMGIACDQKAPKGSGLMDIAHDQGPLSYGPMDTVHHLVPSHHNCCHMDCAVALILGRSGHDRSNDHLDDMNH